MMTAQETQNLLAGGESLTVEFKSDKDRLPDAEWIETVVCMANHQGGKLIVGVEDDGTVTGLHPYHQTSPQAVAAFIASRTVPPLSVEVNFINLSGGMVAVVSIPAARQPVSSSDGKLLIRYFDTKGKPGCRPLYSHEIIGWRADRGMADPSALSMPEVIWADFDAVEFARLRRMVEENHGDKVLLDLTDEGIAQALGLISNHDGKSIITLAGLLLVGKESALRQFLPAHEVAFQVLRGLDVAVNEFHRWPLLRVHEWLVQAIEVRNEEQELMIDGVRVGVPRYDRRGIREAINNALIHRDYARLGAVHVQLHDDHAIISNPGGFVTGVNVDNVLVAAPHPRNPLLADAFKRIGLVEKTGRGVGIIYTGQLQNGRQRPMYDRSTQVSVTVTLDAGPADLAFVECSIRASKRLGRALTVPELLILWEAWEDDRITVPEAAEVIQHERNVARKLLRQMQQNELITGFFSRSRRYYRPSSAFSRERAPNGTGSVPQAISNQQIEERLLTFARQRGQIRRGEVVELSGLSQDQAYRLLKRLVKQGKLTQIGIGRAVYYRATNTAA